MEARKQAEPGGARLLPRLAPRPHSPPVPRESLSWTWRHQPWCLNIHVGPVVGLYPPVFVYVSCVRAHAIASTGMTDLLREAYNKACKDRSGVHGGGRNNSRTWCGACVLDQAVACSLDDICLMPKARRQPLWAPAGPTIYLFSRPSHALILCPDLDAELFRILTHPTALQVAVKLGSSAHQPASATIARSPGSPWHSPTIGVLSSLPVCLESMTVNKCRVHIRVY